MGNSRAIPIDVVRALNARAAERGTQSLRNFAKMCWNTVVPGVPCSWSWHHDAICDHLQALRDRQIQNLLINMPPRHTKSTLCSVIFPAWIWTSQPWFKFLCSSFGYDLAIRDSGACRALIESAYFRERWGKIVSISGDQNQKERYKTTAGGHRISGSVGGIGTGDGGDLISVDDAHKIEERFSEPARLEVINWWDNTMYNRVNDPKTGRRLVVGHRVHEEDLSGHLMKQGGWAHLCLTTAYAPDRRSIVQLPGFSWDADPRKEHGELLWPDRFGPAEIKQYQSSMTPAAWAALYQQWPAPEGGTRFKREWYKHFTVRHNDIDNFDEYVLENRTVRVSKCQRFAVMDPAGAEKKVNNKPCYSVVLIFDLTPDKHLLLIDIYREQVSVPQAADDVIKLFRRHKLHWIGIEKNGVGLGVVQTLIKKGVTVRPITATGNKEARSEAAEIRMANGQIWFAEGAHWLGALKHELELFPSGEFVDQVDALSHAAMHVNKLSLNKSASGGMVAASGRGRMPGHGKVIG